MSWPFPIQQDTQGWPMQIFVVYENPRDAKPGYPYIVTRWELSRAEGLLGKTVAREAMMAQTLEAARSLIPEGMVHTMPMNGDDPCILEVWV